MARVLWLCAFCVGCGGIVYQTDTDVDAGDVSDLDVHECDDDVNGTDADTDATVDEGAEGTDVDCSDAVIESDADADLAADAPDAEADADTDDVDIESDVADAGVEDVDVTDTFVPVTDCTGYPDFTPCVLVTDPDRAYDICSSGVCVSPGCGSASCNAPGPGFPLADTGQRVCYNGGGFVSCPGVPGDSACATTPFCGQDAQYGWDVDHLPTERYTVVTTDEPTVFDNVTGLVWQGCPFGLRGSSCEETIAVALDCESLVWAGQNDWRFPSAYELHSIMDYQVRIDSSAFPATPLGTFLTSSFAAAFSSYSVWWTVRFDSGGLGFEDRSAWRCVRGGTAPLTVVHRYRRWEPVIHEPIVEDALTGLSWQGCLAGSTNLDCFGGERLTRNWEQALAFCEGLVWAGFSDWRLPNVVELRSIVDDRRYSTAFDSEVFPGVLGWTRDWYCWTSTANPLWLRAAYYVETYSGQVSSDDKTAAFFSLRCVRGVSGG